MGSCGSSLDCQKCFAYPPKAGCEAEVDVNADIVGIGVSILSLLLSDQVY
jgi:hypothetical protein